MIFYIASFIFLFALPRYSEAYIDPGTGSYLLQIVVGFIFGSLLTLKIFYRNIKSFFIRKFSNNKKADDDTRHV